MNLTTQSVYPCDAKGPSAGAVLRSVLGRLIWIIPAVALFCVVIFLALGHTKFSQSGMALVITFIYSVFIGTPSALLLPLVNHRYTERNPRLIFVFDIAVLLGTATVGTLAGALFLQVVGIVGPGYYWLEFRESYPISIVITLMVGLGITLFETMRFKLQAATLELRTRQMEQERANKLLAEARLSSLESRIHPHFLFNTLNSIAALIPSDPQRAEDTVGKLASLLRFSLNANQGGLVLLEQELKVVRDYLEIEKTRFNSRLRYEIAAPEYLEEVKVPPLALQTLVENAVKHVVSQRTAGATIQVSGRIDARRVFLTVTDDGPGFALDAISPDHGLGNLSARLELLFGAEGRLDVRRENGKTAVSVSFPA